METGVAYGVSTFHILNALNKNGNGSLISVDISRDVATFLNNEEKQRWNLKVLNTRDKPWKQFHKIMNEFAPLSVYLHDGDHSYPWQRMEYDLALQKLRRGGILLSDDVDSSYAFIDSCGRNLNEFGSIAIRGILIGRSKIFGYATKG
ncbi:MAG: class I SAM-dependent methyltransferase [Thermoplasmatales archaeon]